MTDLLNALDKLQTPVGLSVTGSPVYALTPLPPGAEAGAAKTQESLGTPLAGPPLRAATPHSAGPDARRARTPTTRAKDEPQFVTGEKPVTFEHVFTESEIHATRRRWPIIVIVAMLVGAAAGTIVLVAAKRGGAVAKTVDAGVVAMIADGAPAVDAGLEVVVQVAADAALADAPDIVIVVDGPPRIRPRVDAGTGSTAVVTPNGRGTMVIKVSSSRVPSTAPSGPSTSHLSAYFSQPVSSDFTVTSKA
jgi:hypothetical protein